MDANLTALADFKAKDMTNNLYVGHVDSRGEYILGTAKRAGIRVLGSVGENVAGGTVGVSYLQA